MEFVAHSCVSSAGNGIILSIKCSLFVMHLVDLGHYYRDLHEADELKLYMNHDVVNDRSVGIIR